MLGKYDDNIPQKPSNAESPPQWQYNGKDYPYYEASYIGVLHMLSKTKITLILTEPTLTYP